MNHRKLLSYLISDLKRFLWFFSAVPQLQGQISLLPIAFLKSESGAGEAIMLTGDESYACASQTRWRWGKSIAGGAWPGFDMTAVPMPQALPAVRVAGSAAEQDACCCLPVAPCPCRGWALGSQGGGHWWLGKLEATGGGKGLQPWGKGQPPVPGLQVLKEWNVSKVWRSGNIL